MATNRTVKRPRQARGTIVKRSEDSLSIRVYVKADLSAGTPERQLWETVRRLPDETDTDLRRRAAERIDSLLSEQRKGVNVYDTERLTVGRYLREWLDRYQSDSPDSRTPATYRYIAEHYLIPHIGDVLLPKLTTRRIEDMLRKLRDGDDADPRRHGPLSGQTRRHALRVLSQAINKLVQDGQLGRNVCITVDASLHKPQKFEPYKITRKDRDSLIAAAADTDIEALVILLSHTGLRIGEALGLRWRDVDFDADELHIEQALKRIGKGRGVYGAPKTERSIRSVPMLRIVADALYSYRERQRQHHEREGLSEQVLVFTQADGIPMGHDFVTVRWQQVRSAAGVPMARIHDLRHFAGTHMIEAGVPVHHVSKVLGHSNVTTTLNRYARSNSDDTRGAVAALE